MDGQEALPHDHGPFFLWPTLPPLLCLSVLWSVFTTTMLFRVCFGLCLVFLTLQHPFYLYGVWFGFALCHFYQWVVNSWESIHSACILGLCFFLRIGFEFCPNISFVVTLLWCLYSGYRTLTNWYEHLRLSFILADWAAHQALQRRLALSIKPRRRPWPPPLLSYPSHLLIFSAIMITMWRTTFVLGSAVDCFPSSPALLRLWSSRHNVFHSRLSRHRPWSPNVSRVYRY